MSPLSIDLSLLGAKHHETELHIIFDNKECLAKLSRPKEQRIVWEKRWSSPHGPVVVESSINDRAWFESIARELDQLVGATAPQIIVVLPDPEFKHVRMQMEEIPGDRESLQKLIRWRLQEEFYIDTNTMDTDYHFEKSDEITVFTIEQSLLNGVVQTFKKYNLLVAAFQPYAVYLLERTQTDAYGVNFILHNEGYFSYGMVDKDQSLRLFQSEYVDVNDSSRSKNLYKRARRDFISASLSRSEEEQLILWLGRGEPDSDVGNIPGFKLQLATEAARQESAS
ncbi:MAG: hypothetical protein HUJ29_07835 [Gammaproteobacteria bacterium]|nr:hypothetical protein [Gammaproteobacteria bacterium]